RGASYRTGRGVPCSSSLLPRWPLGRVMIGVLVVAAGDSGDGSGAVGLLGGAHRPGALHVRQAGVTALITHLVEDRDEVRRVETADGEAEAVALIVAIEQRGTAVAAEAALDVPGTAERRGNASGPGQV